MNSLYPHTTYGCESGGDPEVIPELTYESFWIFTGSLSSLQQLYLSLW